jgi:murein DD-endopeptidase MepM/ murein hydrolase activator NlpD
LRTLLINTHLIPVLGYEPEDETVTSRFKKGTNMDNYAAKIAKFYSTEDNPISQEKAMENLCKANGNCTPEELQEKINNGEPIKEPANMCWTKDIQRTYVQKPDAANNNTGESGAWTQLKNYPDRIAGLFMGAVDPNRQDFNFAQQDGINVPFAAGTDFRVTSPFSDRDNPTGPGREFHEGVDFGAAENTPIYATSGGVARLGYDTGLKEGYGNRINIYDEIGNYTLYGHLSGFNISSSQRIRRGDLIGFVGSTGRSTENCIFIMGNISTGLLLIRIGKR